MNTNNDIRTRQVERLQENLLAIRKIAGWTAEELGDKIGVTKQTISNWENYKTNKLSIKTNGVKMGLVHYIAIRHILDYEIETSKNELLSQTVAILLDSDEKELPEEKYIEVKELIGSVASVASGGAFGIAAGMFAKMVMPLFGPVGAVGGVVGVVASIVAKNVNGKWLKNIWKEKKKD